MPIIKSAKKRVKVARKATIRNSKTKRSLRTAVKAFHKALTGDSKEAATTLSEAQSNLDKAVKKGIIHKNKAARQKSQLAAKAKAAGATVGAPANKPAKATKKAVPKAAAKAAKPAAAKKAAKPAAKPVAKKAPAKKPAAK
jgi:small subunit ribosomal protein S20